MRQIDVFAKRGPLNWFVQCIGNYNCFLSVSYEWSICVLLNDFIEMQAQSTVRPCVGWPLCSWIFPWIFSISQIWHLKSRSGIYVPMYNYNLTKKHSPIKKSKEHIEKRSNWHYLHRERCSKFEISVLIGDTIKSSWWKTPSNFKI